MSSLLHEYRTWVRGNPEAAQQFEQITRLAVFVAFAPTSLLSMEASHSFVNVIGDINQSVLREEEEHANNNHNNAQAQEAQRKINTYASVVRMIRETQNCGELLVRKFSRQFFLKNALKSCSSASSLSSLPSTVKSSALGKSSMVVQFYVAIVELTKLFFRFKQNEDIWRIVLPQLFSFRDQSSTKSDAIRVPHIIPASSSSSNNNQNQNHSPVLMNLTRADRVGLWIDLIDLLRPVVMSVALAAGSIWHRRRALHKAWMIWLLGFVYEIIAWLIQNYYLKKYRGAFLRESTGALVQRLHDRTREQLIGFSLLRYPFFNLVAEPEIRRRVLSPGAWIGKIPLFGGIIQGLVEYQIQIQKQCGLFASGS